MRSTVISNPGDETAEVFDNGQIHFRESNPKPSVNRPLVYLTNTAFAISETFKRDTVLGLDDENMYPYVIADRRLDYNLQGREIPIKACGYLSKYSAIRKTLRLVSSAMGKDKGRIFDDLRTALSCKILAGVWPGIYSDAVYVDYGTVASEILGLISGLKLRLVVHFHGYDASSALANRWYAARLQKVFSYASSLIVPSQHVKRVLVLLGAPPEKLNVVHYGLDLRNLLPQPWDAKTRHPSVVFVGRLTPKKNAVALVESFARVIAELPNARMTIIGDGPDRNKVAERIERLGLQGSIDLLGALPQDQVLERMRTHWIYAQHSVTSLHGDQEGFPVSIIEAAAQGLPAVATWHSGIPEGIDEGQSGFMVREHDYETMAVRMITLLRDPGLTQRMGLNARNKISQLCDKATRSKRISEILQNVTSEKP